MLLVGASLLFSSLIMVMGSTSSPAATNASGTVVVSIPSAVKNMNPLYTNSYYDEYIYAAIYQPLWAIYNNSGTNGLYGWHIVPTIASSYSVAANGTTWTINLRSGLQWSDGVPLNASDVLFTYQMLMNKLIDTSLYGSWHTFFADNSSSSMRMVNATQLVFNFKADSLPANNTYSIVEVFDSAIFPEHVFAPIVNNPGAWQNDITDTGTGTARTVTADGKTITINGPIGSGPYTYAGYDSTNKIWSLQASDVFTNTNAAIEGGLRKPSIETIKFTIISDATTAVANLNSGAVQYVDYNTGLNGVYSQLNASTVAHPLSVISNGYQELGYNQYNPIFGMNPPDQVRYYKNNSVSSPVSGLWYVGNGNETIPQAARANNMAWIGQEQIAAATTNNGNATADQWFYNHFTSTDRLDIRLAFDYAIPRDAIISSIENGHGYTLGTWVTPYFSTVYDPTVQARPFNQTISEQYLSSVFGYTYNSSATDYTGVPYFTMNFLVPNSNPSRILWASQVQNSFLTIGINVNVKTVTFNTLLNRAFYNQPALGYDYYHGGWDSLFVGGAYVSPVPDFRSFVQTQYYEAGGNYYLINNTQATQIKDNMILQPSNQTAVHAFLTWFVNNVPSSLIVEDQATFGIANSLSNTNPVVYQQWNYNEWTFGGSSTSPTPFSPIWIIALAFMFAAVPYLVFRKKNMNK